ncbi:hypothetical protein GS445_07190 [Rhodococcus hoagii]|uniref:Minor capsid protein n=7 Tax=Rhodococcus hoagii TaxID=43767 RepID=A0A9Q5EXW4_RHOHA|nr:phage minor capsid protein [Prescottella equi]MBM4481181.1 hypothetical protein [Prescottella equi]MBM4489377.1 hypothetical protein [Prescottella equi]MBM4496226.1 hypothetical protein [Prescottella equi]MBM4549463.1 hypothetical protein [Prescottella equi]MBM4567414.1 hypothetical protein [Prescottella equi]
MALDPSEAAGIPDELIAMYSDAELALLAAMTQAILEGIDTPDWEAHQPLEMLRFRQAAEAIAAQLQAQMPAMVTAAVTAAAAKGVAAADVDLADVPNVLPKPPEGYLPPRRTQQQARDAWVTLAQFTQRIPGNSERLYQDVVSRVQVRDVPAAGGTRLDAVQEALNHLTKRGITGFRDNRGRNWSLTSYLEMKSRTIVNQTLIDSHTDRMVERGQDLIVVSSHRNPAPQCQPFEGQVLSLSGETGTVIRPSAVGGRGVKVRIKATLEQARAAGFQHPNCGHAVSAFVPGASRTFKTEPNPEGYEATQQQRAMERGIRDTKLQLAVAATPQAKRELNARLKAQREAIRDHIDEWDLKRRPKREQLGAR